MVTKKALMVLIAVNVVSGLWIGQAISQQEGREGRRGGRGRLSPEERRERMEQWRKQAAERLRETLGASEEEWKALQPRIEKVQTSSRQLRGGTMRGRRGRGGRGRRPAPEGTEARPQSDLRKKAQALRKVLENKESKAADIKPSLKALREAREKARTNLEKARKDLREIVTIRQEAHLVLMGILD